MSEQIPGYIREAGQRASQAAGVAGDTAAGAYTVGDLLTKKIAEAYSYNKDIIDKLDVNTRDYFSAPSEARVKYEGVHNPFSRESLVSQYVGNKALPMLSEANVLGARMGGVSDLVQSGVQGYQAMAAREQSRAQMEQQNYENLLNEFQIQNALNATTTQEVTAGGRKYLITYDKKGNIIKKEDLGSSGTGDGSGGDMLSTLLKLQQLQKGEAAEDTNIGANYWEDVVTFADLNDTQKREALQRSVNSSKSIDEIAREIVEGANKPKTVPGGTYGSTGTPGADLNYSGLNYTGFKL